LFVLHQVNKVVGLWCGLGAPFMRIVYINTLLATAFGWYAVIADFTTYVHMHTCNTRNIYVYTYIHTHTYLRVVWRAQRDLVFCAPQLATTMLVISALCMYTSLRQCDDACWPMCRCVSVPRR
jgi:hypothetical protein